LAVLGLNRFGAGCYYLGFMISGKSG